MRPCFWVQAQTRADLPQFFLSSCKRNKKKSPELQNFILVLHSLKLKQMKMSNEFVRFWFGIFVFLTKPQEKTHSDTGTEARSPAARAGNQSAQVAT